MLQRCWRRADRKIDLARDQNEGHAHGHDPKQRNLPAGSFLKRSLEPA
jgi:hypothetical protein